MNGPIFVPPREKNYCDYTTRIDFDEFSVAQLIELS